MALEMWSEIEARLFDDEYPRIACGAQDWMKWLAPPSTR